MTNTKVVWGEPRSKEFFLLVAPDSQKMRRFYKKTPCNRLPFIFIRHFYFQIRLIEDKNLFLQFEFELFFPFFKVMTNRSNTVSPT